MDLKGIVQPPAHCKQPGYVYTVNASDRISCWNQNTNF